MLLVSSAVRLKPGSAAVAQGKSRLRAMPEGPVRRPRIEPVSAESGSGCGLWPPKTMGWNRRSQYCHPLYRFRGFVRLAHSTAPSQVSRSIVSGLMPKSLVRKQGFPGTRSEQSTGSGHNAPSRSRQIHAWFTLKLKPLTYYARILMELIPVLCWIILDHLKLKQRWSLQQDGPRRIQNGFDKYCWQKFLI